MKCWKNLVEAHVRQPQPNGKEDWDRVFSFSGVIARLQLQSVKSWLVVYLSLWKMMEFVSWDYYSQYMGMGQNLLLWILVGWTSIYQLFWGLLGTRVLTHSHMEQQKMFHKPPRSNRSLLWSNCDIVFRSSPDRSPASTFFFFFFSIS